MLVAVADGEDRFGSEVLRRTVAEEAADEPPERLHQKRPRPRELGKAEVKLGEQVVGEKGECNAPAPDHVVVKGAACAEGTARDPGLRLSRPRVALDVARAQQEQSDPPAKGSRERGPRKHSVESAVVPVAEIGQPSRLRLGRLWNRAVARRRVGGVILRVQVEAAGVKVAPEQSGKRPPQNSVERRRRGPAFR